MHLAGYLHYAITVRYSWHLWSTLFPDSVEHLRSMQRNLSLELIFCLIGSWQLDLLPSGSRHIKTRSLVGFL
jgi:hypothetical protein